MPFRLANTLIIFQLYIYKALGGLVDCIYVVYLNDILIYLENKDQYKQHIYEVLKYLNKWGLYAKALKYIFNTKQIKFLSYIVTLISVIIDLI